MSTRLRFLIAGITMYAIGYFMGVTTEVWGQEYPTPTTPPVVEEAPEPLPAPVPGGAPTDRLPVTGGDLAAYTLLGVALVGVGLAVGRVQGRPKRSIKGEAAEHFEEVQQ